MAGWAGVRKPRSLDTVCHVLCIASVSARPPQPTHSEMCIVCVSVGAATFREGTRWGEGVSMRRCIFGAENEVFSVFLSTLSLAGSQAAPERSGSLPCLPGQGARSTQDSVGVRC